MNCYPDIVLYENSGDVYSVDFSHEGSLLASANSDGSIRVCYPTINQELWRFEGESPARVRFSSDSRKVVASASVPPTLNTWDVTTGKLISQIPTPEYPSFIRFSPLSNLLGAVDLNGVCTFWDLDYVCKVGSLDFYGEPVRDFSFSSDGTLIAVSQGTKVYIWDAVRQGLLCSFNGHRAEVAAAAFSPNNRYVASGDDQGTLIFWEIHTLRTVWVYTHRNAVRSMAFNASGKRLAVAYTDRYIEIIDVSSGGSEILLSFPDEIFELTFSHVDKCLAVAGAGALRIWCEGSDRIASDAFPGATAQGWIKPRQAGTSLIGESR